MDKFLKSNFTKSILALSLLFQVACSNEAIEEPEAVATDTATTEIDESLALKKFNPPEFPISGKTYYIMNLNSYKFLDVQGFSKNDGGNVHQWDFTGATNQQWKIYDADDKDGRRIVSVSSGKCLDVARFSKSNGGNVHQWGFWGGDNQLWNITHIIDTEKCFITNKFSDHRLEVANYAMSKGGNIQQWEPTSANNQRWYFVPI